MIAFRLLLMLMVIALGAYTIVVIAQHGPNLFPTFFGDMALLGWAGQFNLDFTFMLTLSGLWVAWRHAFSGAGIALGVLAFFGGAMFLTIYLLIVISQAKGEMPTVLLGHARAAGRVH